MAETGTETGTNAGTGAGGTPPAGNTNTGANAGAGGTPPDAGTGPGTGGGSGPGADTGAGGSFLDALGEEDRHYVVSNGWDKRGVGGMVHDYRQLQAKLGKDPLVVPGEDAPPEDWDAVYDKLGRPEKPDGYELKPPEGVEVNPDLESWFRENAHKHGLTARQAQGLFDEWNAAQQRQVEDFQQKSDQAFERIKAAKGADYENFRAAAQQAVRQFVPKGPDGQPDSAILDLMEKSLGSAPMFEIWGAIGEKIANFSTLEGGGGPGGAGGLTPDGAKAELDKLERDAKSDPKHPFNDSRHPNYAATAARWKQLVEIAYPNREEVS